MHSECTSRFWGICMKKRTSETHSAKALWVYSAFSCFAATTPMFSPNSYLFAGMPYASSIGWFIFPLFIAATATGIWIVARPHATSNAQSVRISVGCIYIGATLACALCTAAPMPLPALAVIFGILCGIISIYMLVYWAEKFSLLNYAHALWAAALLCLETAFISIATFTVPEPARISVEAALVCIGTWVAIRPSQTLATFGKTHGQDSESPNSNSSSVPNGVSDISSSPSSMKLFYTLRMPALAVFLYAFVMSINKAFIFGVFDSEYIGGIIASCIIMGIAYTAKANLSSLANHVVMPLLAAIMLLLSTISIVSSNSLWAQFGIYICMSVAALIASAQFMAALHAGEYSPRFIVGNAAILWSIVSLIGLVCVHIAQTPYDFTTLLVAMIAVFCAIMIVSLGLDSWRLINMPANDSDNAKHSATASETFTLPPDITKPLTKREKQVCTLLARGHTYTYIAEQLFISESTVRTHAKHIYKKLDIHSREDLFARIDELNSHEHDSVQH